MKKIALSLFLLFSTALQGRAVSRFETTLALNLDGSAIVIETIALVPPPAAFERNIRVKAVGRFGTRRHLLIDVVGVTDPSGKLLEYHLKESGDYLTISIPKPLGGLVKVTYGVRNAVDFLADRDELFWVTNDPKTSVEDAYFNLIMPSQTLGQFNIQGYLRPESGAAQSTLPARAFWSYDGRVLMQSEGNITHFRSPGPLLPGVAMTVNIFLPKGILEPPNPITRLGWFLGSNRILLLPLIALAVMLVLRKLKVSSTDVRRSVVPRYGPPEGFTPAEVGLLVDDHLDPRDIAATLIDLAVRGYVRLEPVPPNESNGHNDYVIRLLKPRQEWTDLLPHERTMLFHTFYGGHWTKLSSLKQRFYSMVPFLREDVLYSLKKKGMYRLDPESAQAWRMGGFVIVAGLLIAAQVAGIVSLFDSPTLAAFSILVSAGIIHLLGRNLTAKTRRGMKVYIEVLGFEEFLNAVDRDRLERVPPESVQTFLPYFVALGIEHRWAKNFQGIAIRPDWYRSDGTHAFSSDELSNFVSSLFLHMNPSPGSTPRGKKSFAVQQSEEHRQAGTVAADNRT